MSNAITTNNIKKNCPVCNLFFLVSKNVKEKYHKKFCSQSCAATFNNKKRGPQSEETKMKKSVAMKKRADLIGRKYTNINGMFVKVCKICKITFYHKNFSKATMCSDKCRSELKRRVNRETEARLGGLWQRRNSRSKGERILSQKLIDIGLNVVTNKKMFKGFDADIILPDYKIAVHWNGAWHWKPIAGEKLLSKIKHRDDLRYKAIEECGYINYVIIDHKLGTPEFAANIHFRKLMRYLEFAPTWT